MKKLSAAVGLIIVACLAAGVYGMLHNQISYTVSPEYFTQFKFVQFALPLEQQNRWGASIVGWRASWWMGIIISIILIPLGLIMPTWQRYIRSVLWAFLVVIMTTLLVGIGGLLDAIISYRFSTPPDFGFRLSLNDPVAFACAGRMHNFSYLGGLIGIGTGSLFLIIQRIRLSRHLKNQQT